MTIEAKLSERCQGVCELCNSMPAEHAYVVSPKSDEGIQNQVALCNNCFSHLDEKDQGDYWRCAEGSVWSAEPSVQALGYRILYTYKDQEWANQVISSVDLDEDTLDWAKHTFIVASVHKDAFGNQLESGDTVVLTQGLDVKGTSFSAAKGTIIKKIRLVKENTEQIEGRINDQTIVLMTKFVKKG